MICTCLICGSKDELKNPMLRAPIIIARAASMTPGTFKIDSTVNPPEDFSSVSSSAAEFPLGIKIAISVAFKNNMAPVTANGKMYPPH